MVLGHNLCYMTPFYVLRVAFCTFFGTHLLFVHAQGQIWECKIGCLFFLGATFCSGDVLNYLIGPRKHTFAMTLLPYDA